MRFVEDSTIRGSIEGIDGGIRRGEVEVHYCNQWSTSWQVKRFKLYEVIRILAQPRQSRASSTAALSDPFVLACVSEFPTLNSMRQNGTGIEEGSRNQTGCY